MKTKGTVYLVGAGPGDPGLISVRGAELLRRADLVIYDHLVNPSILKDVKPGCAKLYAGKTPRQHTLTQKKINRALVRAAKKYPVVVRLKGGDPFVFGRGGEEAAELARARIPFEVVPGITSAVAGPAYAGIPVTLRGLNSLLSIATGHEDPTKNNSHLDWAKLAHPSSTLVFLMGVAELPQIAKKLMENGLDRRTPAAIIAWATWPRQKTFTGTLENIAAVARQNKVEPPAIVVVGKVVRLRRQLSWFEHRPLFGRRIVVTRARAQASDLADILRDKGAEVMEFPTIKIQPLRSYRELDHEIRQLSRYDWLIFTSANGVEYFFERLNAAGKDSRALSGAKLCAIGPATAAALQQKGLQVNCMPDEFVAEAVIRRLKKEESLAGKKILLPRAREAREVLAKELQKLGAQVREVPAYETVVDSDGKKENLRELKIFPPDVVTFTSSSTVKNFIELAGRRNLKTVFGKTKFVSIGPITSKTARGLGLRVAAQAKRYTIPGLVAAVEKLLRKSKPVVARARRARGNLHGDCFASLAMTN